MGGQGTHAMGLLVTLTILVSLVLFFLVRFNHISIM